MEHSQEKESQAGHDTRDNSSQVETEDTAQARAEAQMYGEEPGLDYWKKLAEKRRWEVGNHAVFSISPDDMSYLITELHRYTDGSK